MLDDELRAEWGGKGWCINAVNWADNTPHAMTGSGDVCVQDFYEVTETENIKKKISYAQEQLERAATWSWNQMSALSSNDPAQKHPFYINFLSGANFWKTSTWPQKIAERVNPAMVEWLCQKHSEDVKGDSSTGIVVCDWVGEGGDWDLVRCIVGFNAKLLLKEKGPN